MLAIKWLAITPLAITIPIYHVSLEADLFEVFFSKILKGAQAGVLFIQITKPVSSDLDIFIQTYPFYIFLDFKNCKCFESTSSLSQKM